MDSLSQIALGAAVGVAVMGRRTAPWKAALAGAVAGTLPDLDVFVDRGDAVANMTQHRTETHALFWLTLATPLLGTFAAWALRGLAEWRRWWLAVWLALVTHPLLDAMTVYGTQLLLPFTDHPFGVGSIFIIDPLYTLPLLAGTVAALWSGRLRWNAAGLALSCAYLAWTVAAQAQVRGVAERSLAAQGIRAERVLVTPAPLQTLLWRVVAVSGNDVHEGFRSLLDAGETMRFDRFERGLPLREALRGHPPVERMVWFTHGFWALRQEGARVVLADLRMGQEPDYVFRFVVGRSASPVVPVAPPESVGGRGDAAAGLRWLWARMWGAEVPPPR